MSVPRLDGVRVLIVDDDRDILGSTDLAFRGEGATTILAADGNSAVLAAESERPDIVILDMMLPERSGFMVMERIAAMAPPPPVIMVTANQGKRHMTYAEGLGVSAYMVKPVPLHRLLDTAARLLGRPTRPARADGAKSEGGSPTRVRRSRPETEE